MDNSNYQNVIAMARNSNDIKKVRCILEIDEAIQLTDVPDPYYGNIADFKNVFQLLDKACNTLSNKLQHTAL